MSDKVNAARVAWTLIKLSEVGTRPVDLGQIADRVGLAARSDRLYFKPRSFPDSVLARAVKCS
jgi:hypothetical protein